jgi:hypothetical protein
VAITMQDSYGDGWNGNYLHLGDVSITLPYGSYQERTVCLLPGLYTPTCCGGSWDYEVSWTIRIDGNVVSIGGADDDCIPLHGSFIIVGDNPNPTEPPGYSMDYSYSFDYSFVAEAEAPTPIPSVAPTTVPPTRAPTSAPTVPEECHDVAVTMRDSFGDGWNGNFLHIGANTFTISYGTYAEQIMCLPPGSYYPYCCGGSWDSEVSWTIEFEGNIVSTGGADDLCSPQMAFTVTAPVVGATLSPTRFPTSIPTPQPTTQPTSAPTYVAGSCEVLTIVMHDSWGDGWNGHTLRFDTVAVTMLSGSYGTQDVCVPFGTYTATCCGGSYALEVSWEIMHGGVVIATGGADGACSPQATFSVASEVTTAAPSASPSPAPTAAPTPYGTANPTPPPTFANGGMCLTGRISRRVEI